MRDSDGKDLLVRLMNADHLLEPTKSADYFGLTPDTLKDTRPIFKATWVFKDPNAPGIISAPVRERHPGRPGTQEQPKAQIAKAQPLASLIVVQVDWTDDEEGLLEMGQPNYYRLQSGHSGPKENMDLKLLELGE